MIAERKGEYCMNKVYRRQRIEGTVVGGIIKNFNYYFSLFGVYEDGVVNCWHKNDLWQFEYELKRQWVVPSVPVGKRLSIFKLGNFLIQDAVWLYNEKGYYNHIKDVVKSLNPEMQNLYHTTKREIEKWKKYHASFAADFTPFRLKHEFGYNTIDGDKCHIFYRENDTLYLTMLSVYEDGMLQIGLQEKYYTWEEIETMFDENILCVKPNENEWVHIPDLGRVLFGECASCVSKKEKKASVFEMRKNVMHEQTAHEKCIQAYHNYLEYPCDETKATLKKAYEAVPEMERCYLGDMDTRDTDYVRILCTDQKREV